MLTQRPVDVQADRSTLLEFHCRVIYESESPWARRMPFEQYREKWLSTTQPEEFLRSLAGSLIDQRTIAEIWEDEGVAVGYLWVTFGDIRDYAVTIAEVNDIAVADSYQRRGIGSMMLARAEQLARQRGAHVLRSETSIENVASQGLHKKLGFGIYHFLYEKVLTADSSNTDSDQA